MFRLPLLFAAIVSLSLRRESAFRANLLFSLLMTLVGAAASLAALGILSTQTQRLGGWSIGELIVLLGSYETVGGLLATFIEPNVAWFAGQVKSGKLDALLLQPAPSLFMATLGTCAPLGLTQVVMGLGIVAGGLRMLGATPSLGGALGWLLLLGVGVTLTWASRVLLAITAFWSPALTPDVLYGALWQLGRYPVSIYRPAVRALLTYVVPVAFVATYPARALTHGANPVLVAQGAVAAGLAVAAVGLTWRAGLRRYTSATS